MAHSSLFASRVFTGSEILTDQVIHIKNGRIAFLEAKEDQYLGNVPRISNLAPGFIDIHINGGSKFHFSQKPDRDTLQNIDETIGEVGTAYTIPALITSSLENMLRGIDAVKEHLQSNPRSGILGLHLEGPYINPAKRGAHMAHYVRKPTKNELHTILTHGKEVLQLITIAPELFDQEQLDMLLDTGIPLSAGHSNATYEQGIAAFSSGIRLVTHLYNAMSPFQHRAPGLVGATFDSEQVYAPIVLDGIHCDYAAARIAWKIKKEKMFLISDALFMGGKVKRFEWENFDAVLEKGAYWNKEGNLSGSAISIADTVRNAVKHVGISLQEAVEMVTIRPATALGMEGSLGRIAKGCPAVFTVFDDDLNEFERLAL
ncbi:N-acetylglucosamine-6-phosphate deacetylase [Olivibacter sitiensis]|uniref:N-acetylglucosamine-6-phosphate deacetylase n=1 Tax=Olivibacter sitiensis TaxID=376470 RepID=UPI0004864CDA|nr:N-acetylglucosamine-6-phosphate deacetylase [Olivibacter sitiensis]